MILFKWTTPDQFFNYFRRFDTVDRIYTQNFPMIIIEPQTSGVGSDRSTN